MPATQTGTMGRGVHFTAVVIADADARRRRALRDVVGGLDGVDAVKEAGTAFDAALHARDASLVLVDCSLPDADVVEAIALARRAAGGMPVIAVSAGTDPAPLPRPTGGRDRIRARAWRA
jgi:DNA-binding NarL/FixJ family response regulator